MARFSEKRNPPTKAGSERAQAGGQERMQDTTRCRARMVDVGRSGAEIYGLPRSSAEVIQRLQKRLSAFALVMDAVTRDIDRFQELVRLFNLGVQVNERELAEMALRLFDAREVLE